MCGVQLLSQRVCITSAKILSKVDISIMSTLLRRVSFIPCLSDVIFDNQMGKEWSMGTLNNRAALFPNHVPGIREVVGTHLSICRGQSLHEAET
jgi:hypothetical protein